MPEHIPAVAIFVLFRSISGIGETVLVFYLPVFYLIEWIDCKMGSTVKCDGSIEGDFGIDTELGREGLYGGA